MSLNLEEDFKKTNRISSETWFSKGILMASNRVISRINTRTNPIALILPLEAFINQHANPKTLRTSPPLCDSHPFSNSYSAVDFALLAANQIINYENWGCRATYFFKKISPHFETKKKTIQFRTISSRQPNLKTIFGHLNIELPTISFLKYVFSKFYRWYLTRDQLLWI